MRREEQAQPRPAKRSALPYWLSGQTVALIGTMIALGAFGQNGFSGVRQDMNVMRQEMNNMRTELKGDIQSLRTELKGDIADLRTELKGDIADVRSDLRKLENRTRAVEAAVVGNSVRLDNLERVVAGARGLAENAQSRPEAERLAQSR